MELLVEENKFSASVEFLISDALEGVADLGVL